MQQKREMRRHTEKQPGKGERVEYACCEQCRTEQKTHVIHQRGPDLGVLSTMKKAWDAEHKIQIFLKNKIK